MHSPKMSQAEEHPSDGRRVSVGGDHERIEAERAATQFFMANAPPGKLREVMENCELLVDPASVSNRFMERTLEQSSEEQRQLVSFTIPGEAPQQAILCSAGRLNKSQYLHTPTKHVLSVSADGSNLRVSSSPAPAEAFPPDVEPYREALEAALQIYVMDRYSCNSLRVMLRVPVDLDQAVSVFSHRRGDATPTPQLTAVMSTMAESKSSYWTCSWTSEWRVFFSPSDPSSETRLEGDVSVRSYLHEDSSVQANFLRHFGLPQEKAADESNADQTGSRHEDRCLLPSTNVHSPDKFARELVKAIRANEEALIQEIDEFFTNRVKRFTKGMRRMLPVYGKAFDWKQQSIQLRPQKVSPGTPDQ